MTLENGQFMPKKLKVNNYSHVNISKRSKLDVCVSFFALFSSSLSSSASPSGPFFFFFGFLFRFVAVRFAFVGFFFFSFFFF